LDSLAAASNHGAGWTTLRGPLVHPGSLCSIPLGGAHGLQLTGLGHANQPLKILLTRCFLWLISHLQVHTRLETIYKDLKIDV